MVVAIVMVAIVGLSGVIVYANREPAPAVHADAPADTKILASTPPIVASAPAVAASALASVKPNRASKETAVSTKAAASVSASASDPTPAPVLDADSRDSLTWLMEHPDNMPRAVTLAQDFSPHKGLDTMKAGSVIPLGRIIDLDYLVVLIDGEGYKIPIRVTDMVMRAKAAKALMDSEITASTDASATASESVAPVVTPKE